MASFNERFSFSISPFEHYVAENEPHILEYAVVPPYFEVSRKRAQACSTHVLFGARGTGKSATRLATERDIWKRKAQGEKVPLVVPLVDFAPLLENNSANGVTADQLVKRVAFQTIETLLLYLSDEKEGAEILDLLDADETVRLTALAKAFYLNIPENQRKISQEYAMKLLRQNWINSTVFWAEKKWPQVARIVAAMVDNFGNNETGEVTSEIKSILDESGNIISSVAVLGRLVEATQTFGFSGISVFVDKVDEHPKTQNSPQQTAALVHPLLAQVQLMEIQGLGWQFFLWDKVNALFSTENFYVRLDKIATSEVDWSEAFLASLIQKRIVYFSKGSKNGLSDLCVDGFDVDAALKEAIELAGRSPRELIRIFDVISREFDAKYAADDKSRCLGQNDFQDGMDKYVQDVIYNVYDNAILSQLVKLGKQSFINKDLQEAFKISYPAATNKITKWTSCEAVRMSGTRAAEGDAGGKPANEYSISDTRIRRFIERELFDVDKLTDAGPL